MAHQISVLFFLALNLTPIIIASPAAFIHRRGLLWDDSGSQYGILGAGAAGLGALQQLWNQWTVPSNDPTLPSITQQTGSLQDENLDEPGTPNTPDPQMLPLYQPSTTDQCATSFESTNKKRGLAAIVDSLFSVEQDPETGRPKMSSCDPPEAGAYIVHEIRYDGGNIRRFWKRWRAAILVTDITTNEDIKYELVKNGAKFIVHRAKVVDFLQKGKVIKLGYMRRRGWIVGAGAPKEEGLSWFEQFVGTNGAVSVNAGDAAEYHFSSAWTRNKFAKLFASGSPHWVPLDDGKQLPL